MPRILFVTPLAPWPTHDGGRQRTHLLHRALASCGEVDTVIVSRRERPPSAEDEALLRERFGLVGWLEGTRIGEETPWRLVDAVSPSLADRLAHTLAGWQTDYRPGGRASRWMAARFAEHRYDLVVGRYLWPVAHAGLVGRSPLIVDVDDLESEVLGSSLDDAEWPAAKRWWWRRRVRQVASAERRLLARCDHAWLTKPQDADAVPAGRWSLLPNVPLLEGDGPAASLPEPANGNAILFVGSLGFAPNLAGIERFLERSWPMIRAACPDAELHLVGSRLTDERRSRWGAAPGVKPIGFVDDIREAYGAAAFSVVPVWQGAGTKIKLLESLMLGRTVVTARHSLRGYEQHLVDGESLRVGDDDASLAEACVALLRDAAARRRLASEGRQKVLKHYSMAGFDRLVREGVTSRLGPVAVGDVDADSHPARKMSIVME